MSEGQLASAAFWGGVRGLQWVGQRERCLIGQLNDRGGMSVLARPATAASSWIINGEL